MKTKILTGILGILLIFGCVISEINALSVESQAIKGYHIVTIWGTITKGTSRCPGVASNCCQTIYTPIK